MFCSSWHALNKGLNTIGACDNRASNHQDVDLLGLFSNSGIVIANLFEQTSHNGFNISIQFISASRFLRLFTENSLEQVHGFLSNLDDSVINGVAYTAHKSYKCSKWVLEVEDFRSAFKSGFSLNNFDTFISLVPLL